MQFLNANVILWQVKASVTFFNELTVLTFIYCIIIDMFSLLNIHFKSNLLNTFIARRRRPFNQTLYVMMTEIHTIEGSQKDVSSLERTTLKYIVNFKFVSGTKIYGSGT